ncbi:MAG: TPM domain-containing protein [Myxococcota bacterium]
MLFTDQERATIEAAVREAEATTSGEIVVVDVERSATYGTERALAAALLAAACATAMVLVAPHLPAPYYLLAQVPFFGLVWLLASTSRVQRLLAGGARMDAAARARAASLFSERGVHMTRERTGVLLMLSEIERRVVILADSGINARVAPDAWEKHVATIVDAIHRGAAGDGVASVVREVGTLLAKDFPRRPDDVNELPDRPERAG